MEKKSRTTLCDQMLFNKILNKCHETYEEIGKAFGGDL